MYYNKYITVTQLVYNNKNIPDTKLVYYNPSIPDTQLVYQYKYIPDTQHVNYNKYIPDMKPVYYRSNNNFSGADNRTLSKYQADYLYSLEVDGKRTIKTCFSTSCPVTSLKLYFSHLYEERKVRMCDNLVFFKN